MCFQETGVLEELGRFERHWHVRRKKLLPLIVYFWGDFLGEGVNDSICVENLDLAPKVTSTIWTFLLQNFFFGVEFCFQNGEVLEEL